MADSVEVFSSQPVSVPMAEVGMSDSSASKTAPAIMRPTSWRGRKFCQPPGKSGQAGSGMWRFVGLLEPEDNAEAAATKTVVCLIPHEGEFCGRMINMGKDGSNSNVVKHLRAKHPEEYKYFLQTSSKARLVSSRRIDVLGPNPHKVSPVGSPLLRPHACQVATRCLERKRKKPRTDKQGDDGHGSDETQVLSPYLACWFDTMP